MVDGGGSLPGELLDRGDPSFVDALRQLHDADVLAAFADVWYNDPRPESRRLLLDYLDRPLNAYRHEGLVKRLFKKAEAAGDVEVMARFLVLFDRSIRRVRKVRGTWLQEVFSTKAEAEAQLEAWKALGYRTPGSYGRFRQFVAYASRPDEVIRYPKRNVMPRGRMVELFRGWPTYKVVVPDWAIQFRLDLEQDFTTAGVENLPENQTKFEKCRLFSFATRNYLRRRAWRFFRKLGQTDPGRYVAAVSIALSLYRDQDLADKQALLDNWGLVHILFHHSPALEARPTGWLIRPGRSFGELSPAPMFEKLWDESPGAVVALLSTAPSTTVRHWAIRRIEADPTTHRAGLSIEGWLGLLGHDDPEIIALAARMLEGADGLETVGVDRWLTLVESADPVALEILCALIDRHVSADQVTIDQAVKLAGLRPLPVARLGFGWLKTKPIGDPAQVLGLVDAGCRSLRPEILRWLRSTLDASPALILEFLDSRHADVRAEGWSWFESDTRAFEDIETWRKLLESPYDDVRMALIAELEARSRPSLDSADLRSLWASVLLNIHRGSRAKPVVVRQLVRRLEANPGDASTLIPLLSVALRSVRGPERRAGLVAVVQLVERRAEIEPLVRSSFPELQWIGEVEI